MNKVLIITTEPLPVPGGLTTGAGLRAWGLAEGLRSRGFPVIIATPLEGEQAISQSVKPTDDRVRYFVRSELQAVIDQEKPDVIVMQHWGLVYALPPVQCPLVIDLAGPHLLERLYWGNPDPRVDLEEKIAALRRADFIICGGEFQRHYFYPYLAMAGFDVRTDKFPVIPFSVSPEPVTANPPPDAEITFIYGGAFLAWQNPEAPLRWLLEEMDSAGSGRLLFFGGDHPNFDASGGRFVSICQLLKNHPRVELRGWIPFAELTQSYAAEGHVALDLMERNPERELAYTTRTMVYLQCGLPVIYNNYSEISALIAEHNCGWCLDPEDEGGFRSLVRKIITDPSQAIALRNAARNAALAQSWDKTITPLAEFCEDPVVRPKAETLTSAPDQRHPRETDQPGKAEQTARIKPNTRKFFPNPGTYLGIVVYIPVWLLSKYMYYSSRNTK